MEVGTVIIVPRVKGPNFPEDRPPVVGDIGAESTVPAMSYGVIPKKLCVYLVLRFALLLLRSSVLKNLHTQQYRVGLVKASARTVPQCFFSNGVPKSSPDVHAIFSHNS